MKTQKSMRCNTIQHTNKMKAQKNIRYTNIYNISIYEHPI